MFVTVAIPQLSFVTGVPKVTLVISQLVSALTVTAGGQTIVGTSLSITVMLKLQIEVLPRPSSAVYSIVVVPIGKKSPVVSPPASVWVTVAVPQLSVAVGIV